MEGKQILRCAQDDNSLRSGRQLAALRMTDRCAQDDSSRDSRNRALVSFGGGDRSHAQAATRVALDFVLLTLGLLADPRAGIRDSVRETDLSRMNGRRRRKP